MKKAARVLTAALVISLLIVCAIPALAVTTYTPVAGDHTHGFDKFLVLDADATVPDITFTYTLAPGTAISYTTGTGAKMEVLAGVGSPTVDDAVFTEGMTSSTTVASGDEVTLDTGKAYAKVSPRFDFSAVEFDEPGIYRYILTEATIDTRTDVNYDTQKAANATARQRILDVYVTDDNGTLIVSAYVLHNLADDVLANATAGSDVAATLADKSAGFVNEFASYNLEFGKEVTGNQGSKDKYFDFTLTIAGAQPGMTYTVDISGADATSGSNTATIAANAGKTNAATLTADANGAIVAHYYLQDGQYIQVKGLPRGSTYSLVENAEDYQSTEGIAASIARNSVAHTDAVTGTDATNETDIYTGYTNTRQGVVPTGVLMAVAPFAIIMIVGAVGIGVMVARKRRAK